MRRAARVDDNQTEVVAALRAAGCGVVSLAAVGKGVPDLLVCARGETLLVEVKDGSKPPSKRKLTDAQVDFHRDWRGRIETVTSAEDALRKLGLMGVEMIEHRGTIR